MVTMEALQTLLVTPITSENQESQNAEISKLEGQISKIRREIQVEKEKLAEEQGRLH